MSRRATFANVFGHMPIVATLFSLRTGRTRSSLPAAAATFAVPLAPFPLFTGDPLIVLFRIFSLLAVADAIVTRIAVSAAKFLLGLSSSLCHVAALCGTS